ncbi:unnamed protein product [Aphanomyces euteiches]
MRVFVGNLSSVLGMEMAKRISQTCQVVGAVETLKQTQVVKKRLAEFKPPERQDDDKPVETPVVVYSDKHNVHTLLKRSDVAIYSILDDPDGVVDALQAFEDGGAGESGGEKLFVAISSVLTWAKTPNPTPLPKEWRGHKEEMFKQRKPARKYAEYKAIETQVLSARREGLKTLVVAAGLIYGGAQSHFHAILRDAWMYPNKDLIVPSVGGLKGANVLPMISVYDLAKIAANVALASPASSGTNYMLAVDQSQSTLRDVCLAISQALGNGNLRDVEAAEADELAVKDKSLTPLQLDLRFDLTGAALETIEIDWHFQQGMVANMAVLTQDYLQSMDLRPLRVVVLGPPRVGKTYLASSLAKTYYLPHLTAASMADEFLATPKLDDALVEVRDQVKACRLNLNELSDAVLTQLVRWKLASPVCRNQGYVLDGLPITIDQAKAFFFVEPKVAAPTEGQDGEGKADDNTEEKEGDENNAAAKKASAPPNLFVPNRVIVLNATKALLEARAQQLSQEEADKTGNNAVEFARRYDLFRKNDGLVNHFEKENDLEVLELELEGEEMYASKKDYLDPIAKYMEQGGKPFNFHPTKEELLEQQKELEKQLAEEAKAEEKRQADALEKEAAEKQKRVLSEKSRLEVIQREEMDILEARSKPLRAYLMETVIPALTEGMLEVVKVQPEDPIDYLADFLFKKGQDLVG